MLIHPHSGVLSAYGMGLADIRATRNRAVMARVAPDIAAALAALAPELEDDAAAELEAQGVSDSEITVIARAHLRYDGTDTPIPVTVMERRRWPARSFEGRFAADLGIRGALILRWSARVATSAAARPLPSPS